MVLDSGVVQSRNRGHFRAMRREEGGGVRGRGNGWSHGKSRRRKRGRVENRRGERRQMWNLRRGMIYREKKKVGSDSVNKGMVIVLLDWGEGLKLLMAPPPPPAESCGVREGSCLGAIGLIITLPYCPIGSYWNHTNIETVNNNTCNNNR